MTPDQFNVRYEQLRRQVDRYLTTVIDAGSSGSLDDACRYVLTGGGKRLRAILVLLSCEAAGGRRARALPAAAAVEIMHNFTLVHDDIMDHARTRRGRATVHIRWDLNTALLAGDTLLAIAYAQILRTPTDDLCRILHLFTQGVIGVCEGQALDLEFERRNDITVKDYFTMVEQKTGILISVASELGARIGKGTPRDIRQLRTFGHHLGRAFQMQDDLLDVIGDERQFGKTIGGDILEGKRTYLLLTARERARGSDRVLLDTVIKRKSHPPARKETPSQRRELVSTVRQVYDNLGVIDRTRAEVVANTQRARRALRDLRPGIARDMLGWLADRLAHRIS
ncbi:MAG: polyprenyl synthetase [Bacteroidetes bacterium]|nr:polyprenyl synthetase [Bacteroidota bacterium]